MYDSSGSTFNAYGVQATPTFFIIDKNGQVAMTYQGEVAAETLAADLTRLNSIQTSSISSTSSSTLSTVTFLTRTETGNSPLAAPGNFMNMTLLMLAAVTLGVLLVVAILAVRILLRPRREDEGLYG